MVKILVNDIEKIKKQLEPRVDFSTSFSSISSLITDKLIQIPSEGGSVTLSSHELLEELRYHKAALYTICYAMLLNLKSGDHIKTDFGSSSFLTDLQLKIQYVRNMPEQTKTTVKAKATNEDAEYYNKTGDRYLEGGNHQQDGQKAYSYYQKAAALNDAEGIYNVAWCLEHGRGVKKSTSDAKKYYRQAADMGFVKAMRNYAFMLYFNAKDEHDPVLKESFRYMKMAADQGDASALAHVAQSYQEEGWGAPVVDWNLAKQYLQKAIVHNSEHAMWVLAENYYDGSFGWPKDRVKAAEYYKKGAENGSGRAMREYSRMLFYGDGNLNRSFNHAYYWAQKVYEEEGEGTAWYGALKVRNAVTNQKDLKEYENGKQLLRQCANEDGGRRAEIFLHRLSVLEKYENPGSPGRIDNIIYISFNLYDEALGNDAEEKEYLVEIEYPNLVIDAVEGDWRACVKLSSLFLYGESGKRDPYPPTNIISLKAAEKWAKKAYETRNVKAMENYLHVLGRVGYVDYKVGAYEYSVNKYKQMRKVISEINAVPGYSGFYSKPENLVSDYFTEADALFELKRYDEAANIYFEIIQLHEIPDAYFGAAKCRFLQDNNSYYTLLNQALVMDNWNEQSNRAAALYLMACAQREGFGIPVNIDSSYAFMKLAADMNHEAAKEELPRYKKGIFGYRYQ